MKPLYFIVFALSLLTASSVFGQRLTGRIVDEQTGEAIPFATVFFANTMKGVISKVDGTFDLKDFEPGKYDLVVSYVGYEDYFVSLSFEEGETKEIQITLKTDLVELPEFYLNADTAGRHMNFLTFKTFFLGESENSKQIEILNPEVIFLYFDKAENVLYAHAKEPIEIDNRALGYRLSYLLKDFKMNFRTGQRSLFGIPRFAEKEPVGKRDQKRWDKERRRAFNGSITHFFNAVMADSIEQNKFRVEKIYRIPNRDRPPEEVINRELSRYRILMREEMKKAGARSVVIGEDTDVRMTGSKVSDSLRYWRRMKSLPATVDSVGARVLNREDLLSGQILEYKGLLRVRYTGEREEMAYALTLRRQTRANRQTSVIHFLDKLRLYPNGYYEDVRNVFVEGYWGWSSSISELLPVEYSPPVD